MTSLIRAELLKLRTTRALPVTLGLLLAFTAVAVAAHVSLAGRDGVPALGDDALARLVRLPAQLVGGACLVLGVLAVGGEHRHRTRVLTALVSPRRVRTLVAQLAALAAAGAAVAGVVATTALAAGAVGLAVRDEPVPVLDAGPWAVLLASVVAGSVLAVVGGALGAAVGGTAGALGLAFGWAFLVEGALPVVLRAPELVDRLPGGALAALVAAGPGAERPLGPLAAVVLLAAVAAALAAVAAAATARREL